MEHERVLVRNGGAPQPRATHATSRSGKTWSTCPGHAAFALGSSLPPYRHARSPALVADCESSDEDVEGDVVSPACDPAGPASRFVSCELSFNLGSSVKRDEIAFGFDGTTTVDGDRPDFLIFEDAFLIEELGEVGVGNDGVTWATFSCHKDAHPYTGCAGWNPVPSHLEHGASPFNPAMGGGDPFDLADVGLLGVVRRGPRHKQLWKRRFRGLRLDAAAVIQPSEP
ncbi:Cell surface protein [Minicystis rosea]|nr:Cell surface protein [Minicystis rosea]